MKYAILCFLTVYSLATGTQIWAQTCEEILNPVSVFRSTPSPFHLALFTSLRQLVREQANAPSLPMPNQNAKGSVGRNKRVTSKGLSDAHQQAQKANQALDSLLADLDLFIGRAETRLDREASRSLENPELRRSFEQRFLEADRLTRMVILDMILNKDSLLAGDFRLAGSLAFDKETARREGRQIIALVTGEPLQTLEERAYFGPRASSILTEYGRPLNESYGIDVDVVYLKNLALGVVTRLLVETSDLPLGNELFDNAMIVLARYPQVDAQVDMRLNQLFEQARTKGIHRSDWQIDKLALIELELAARQAEHLLIDSDAPVAFTNSLTLLGSPRRINSPSLFLTNLLSFFDRYVFQDNNGSQNSIPQFAQQSRQAIRQLIHATALYVANHPKSISQLRTTKRADLNIDAIIERLQVTADNYK